MNNIINNIIKVFNDAGRTFCDFSLNMFVQASVLIVVLFLIDILIRKRVRATFRYCIWMLVFIKLVLPPALSLPTGIGNLLGEYFVVNSTNFDKQVQNINPEPLYTKMPGVVEFSPQQAQQLQNYNRMVTPQVTTPPETEITQDIISVEPVVSNTSLITWQGGIFLIWLVGVLVLSVLLIQRIFFVRSLIAQSEPAKNRLLETLEECCKQLGIRRNIQMKLSHNASSPAVCGLFNLVILIPANLLSKISHDQFKYILIHELSHIKRFDLWINCVQTFLQILYFYNPLLWFANSIVRKIREQAVDEMVLVALGADFGELSRTEAKSYTTTLIDVAEMAFSRPALSLRLVGVVESKKALSERIKLILSRPFPKTARLGILGFTVIIIFASIALPMAEMTGVSEPLQRKVVLPYSVWMADITSKDKIKILDFASGDIIEFSGINQESEFVNKINSIEEGDAYVCYRENHNKPMITFFNSAGLDEKRPSNEYQFISPIPMEIPWVTTVWTSHGCKYQFTLVSFDEDNCVIEYKPLNRAAEKAMVEGQEKSPELPERYLSGEKTYKYGEPIQLMFEHAGIDPNTGIESATQNNKHTYLLIKADVK